MTQAFLLIVYSAAEPKAPKAAHFWIGGESPLSYERDSDITEVRYTTTSPHARAQIHTPALEPAQRDANETSPSACLLYTSPSPRDQRGSRMPSSA